MNIKKSIRNQIRETDQKLVSLIDEALKVYENHKKPTNEGQLAERKLFASVWDETYIQNCLKTINSTLPVALLRRIFAEIYGASQAVSGDAPKVAVLGPMGTYTHLAADKYFTGKMDLILCSSIRGIFENLAQGEISFGVVPIENSTEGGVGETLSALIETDLKIYDQVTLNIAHSLLSRNQDLGEIKRVYSHPQAHSQCAKWVASNMPRVQIVLTSSTGEAARRAKEDFNGASISSALAADLFQLSLLKENIQDRSENSTRFVILRKDQRGPTGHDKTSLLFSVKNGPGALLKVLELFNKESIDLSRLESRPDAKKNWEYIFFIDFNGHCEDVKIQGLLAKLNEVCLFVKVLGSYPNSVAAE